MLRTVDAGASWQDVSPPDAAGLLGFAVRKIHDIRSEERAFTRILIHHNKVWESMLNCNDYGGIETWPRC